MKRQIFFKLCIILLCITALFSLFVVGVSADTSETNKTIKAGTYRFNDVLSAPSADTFEYVDFTLPYTIEIDEVNLLFSRVDEPQICNCFSLGNYADGVILQLEVNWDDEEGSHTNIVAYYSSVDNNGGWDVFYNIVSQQGATVGAELYKGYGQTITFTEDAYVSYDFYIWFISNTVELTIDDEPTDSPSDITTSSAYQEGYNKGYADGLSAGANSVRPSAYQEGYDAGKTDGYDAGKTDGYDEGYESGKNVGYVDGFNDGKVNDTDLTDLSFSVVDSITNVFRDMLDFEILGINVLALFVDIIALLLIVFVIKKVV